MSWKTDFNDSVLVSGRSLFENGRVVKLEKNGNNYIVETQENAKYRSIIMERNDGKRTYLCDCPFARTGRRCSHMAAACFALDEKQNSNNRIKPFEKSEEYAYFDMSQMTENFLITKDMYDNAAGLVRRHGIRLVSITESYNGDSRNSELIHKAKFNISSSTVSFDLDMEYSRKQFRYMNCRVLGCYHGFSSWGLRKDLNEPCVHEVAGFILLDKYFKEQGVGDYTDHYGSQFMEQFRKSRSKKFKALSMATIAEDEIFEKIKLEPRLEVDRDGVYASFSAGFERTNIIKNLSEFVKAVEEKGKLKLSEKNDFDFRIHEISDESMEIFKFLQRYVAEENHRVEESKKSFRSAYVSDIRSNISLYGSRMDDFYKLFAKKEISGVSKRMGKSVKGNLYVSEGVPDITLTITENKEDDVFQGIILEGEFPEFIEGVEARYYVTENKLMRIPDDKAEIIAPFIDLCNHGKLKFHLGRLQMRDFYHSVLPMLKTCMNVIEPEMEAVEEYIPPEAKIVFYLDVTEDKSCVLCKAEASYGDDKYNVMDAMSPDFKSGVKRDGQKEKDACKILKEYFAFTNKQSGVFVTNPDEDSVFKFVSKGINSLLLCGEVQCTEEFQALKPKNKVKIRVGVSVESEIMKLDVMTEGISNSELLEILSSYKKKKKYHRLRNGEFISTDDKSIEELSMMMDALKISGKEFEKGEMSVPLYRALYVDKMLKQCEEIYTNRDVMFKKIVKEFKTVSDSDFEAPTDLAKIMRNYQLYGHKWLRTLASVGFGGILADDMGLGKTLQMISVLASYLEHEKNPGTSIIISPASLVYNWKSEFEKFAPHIKVVTVTGNKDERNAIIEDYKDYDVLVTSYDLLRRDIEEYEGKEFAYEIIDEAQYIKNHSTIISKSVKVLKSKLRFALTGTPIENRLSELWSIFDFLMPGFLYKYDTFRKELEIPIVKYKDEDASKRLRRMVSPFILRRLKQDVLSDLPDKIEEVRYAVMERDQQIVYDAQVARIKEFLEKTDEKEMGKKKIEILKELTRIRRICCDPSLEFENYLGESAKKDACIELIKSAIEGEHRMLVFSQFTSMLAILEEELKKEGIEYYKITGETKKEERLKLVQKYNGGTVPVFLISLKAGGTGLNLTGADTVIHYDPWWNVAVQNQATDRAYRIGQTKEVSVYKLIIKGTIEEKIMAMQETKKDLAEEILSSDGTENRSFASLSKDDLMELLDITM